MTVPALVASSPDDIAGLPMEQRGAIITQALEESKSWLAVATKGTDPTPIAEFKAWAATVAEMTRQKGLAEDIQLDALEMVRRAERGIGVAIRNGQEAGEIRGSGNATGANQHSGGTLRPPESSSRRSPLEAAGVKHASGLEGAYSLTDGITDEAFEDGLTAARDERNLSRTNVTRKIGGITEPLTRLQKAEKIRELAEQGCTSRQIADQLRITLENLRVIRIDYDIEIPADRVVGKTRRIDPDRVVSHTVFALEGLRQGLGLLTPEDLDALNPDLIPGWRDSLAESMRSLRNLIKELNTRV